MEYPFVSVIIPTYNEEKYIKKCLEHWINQEYPKDKYEILIFDGLSEDRTLEIVNRIIDKNKDVNIKVFKNEKRKQVYAFNMGIDVAKGDYFIIFGAHAYPEKDFLRKSVETFFKIKEKYDNLAGVGGKVIKIYENEFAKIPSLIYSSPLSGASKFWYSEKGGFTNTVVYALYDKEKVIEVGKFDEEMICRQDLELNLRLNKSGYLLYFNPEIKSYYFTRSNFKRFVKQSFNYAVAKSVLIRKGYFNPIWLMPVFFIPFEIFSFLSVFTYPLFFIPFLIYLLILLIEGIRVGKKEFLKFMFFMFLFHNIISLGVIVGLIFGKKAFR